MHSGTNQPVSLADLDPLCPMESILREVLAQRSINIPEPIRDSHAASVQMHELQNVSLLLQMVVLHIA